MINRANRALRPRGSTGRAARRAVVLAAAFGVLIAAPGAARAERTVTIKGGGFGHGLGMSQYGAYGRALKGKSAAQIVKHYYSGADLAARDMPAVRVGLLQGRSAISFTSSALVDGGGEVVVRVKGTPGKLARGGPGTNWRLEPSPTGGYRVYKGSKQVKQGGNGVFGGPDAPLVVNYQSHDSLVRVTDKSYSVAYGKLEIGTYTSSCAGGYCARVVLVASMQKYLYGLGEVPSSWPQQSLRAQAIAGRTYAYQKALTSGGHRVGCDCAVYDSTYDQAYIGDAKRTGSGSYWNDWKEAVDATDGSVLLYDGNPIQALYSSSSGGYTENNENVWGGTPVPYLRGVPDKPDRAEGHNPNYKWQIEMPFSTFETKMDAAYGTGSLKKFKLVKPFGVSGRVTVVKGDSGGVRIVGSKKTVRESGWSLRATLGLRDTLFRVDLGYAVADKMAQKYRRLDGAPGDPKGPSYPVPLKSKHPKGRAQDFEHGRMTWVKRAGVVWQNGSSLRAYDKLGRERSSLGMPASDSWGTDSFSGASYVNGVIYSSGKTGAHAVTGDWLRAYRKAGGPRGPLGLPEGKPAGSKDLPRRGRSQRFEGGTLYLDPSTATIAALWGRIATRYRRMGEARSSCGYPAHSAQTEKDTVTAEFVNGSISLTGGGRVRVDCPERGASN